MNLRRMRNDGKRLRMGGPRKLQMRARGRQGQQTGVPAERVDAVLQKAGLAGPRSGRMRMEGSAERPDEEMNFPVITRIYDLHII